MEILTPDDMFLTENGITFNGIGEGHVGYRPTVHVSWDDLDRILAVLPKTAHACLGWFQVTEPSCCEEAREEVKRIVKALAAKADPEL